MNERTPQILAPAGDSESFLAALAAGADAVYAGLKHFSARMQADNFSVGELARLAELAREKGARTYVPLNVMVKPGELAASGRLIERLARHVRPEALIVQDLAMLELARQAGYEGELHISTLASATHAASLPVAQRLGAKRVILPRELSIDEIKSLAATCPEGLDLEVFVHGALCYAVSGRCWWSSYLGGKSGLRGRCVQPCRRRYSRGGPGERLFSCRDLSLDVLVRLLADVPQVSCWKIEGRKKGPHYVYYAVSAYKALRDGKGSPESRKAAEDYLAQALGRPRTHYGFLPQKPHPAVTPSESTASGRFIGKVAGSPKGGSLSFTPREPLLKGDRLRVGFEDEPGHMVVFVNAPVPKKGRYTLRPQKGNAPRPGSAVYLIDRREPELTALLARLRAEFEAVSAPEPGAASFTPRLPAPAKTGGRPLRLDVHRRMPSGRQSDAVGLWLRPGGEGDISRGLYGRVWWWLPPVLWPEEEEWVRRSLAVLTRGGARRFVCNSPWQIGLFPELGRLDVWAGPFCNLANGLAIQALKELGFSGAFASPELPREDLLELPRQSPLPLGVVSGGMWPLCLSRTKAAEVKSEEPLKSPKGEVLWVRAYGPTWWIYPGWPLDLSAATEALRGAGYSVFANLHEHKPGKVPAATRTSAFNLDLQLL
ncbi:peptidase U32 [Desulfovibrio sp. X2]|uniref:peptidase U32 family protein n=1 Tax=Desulfovibrio sp. X2 TaxID=941449 RepID=UPI000358F268|nr:U32 family peptidase [Desulfovibrio sp. X2]EPR38713.1 peptidase U32 [Desulfovibrio sp. X2]